MFMGLVAVTSRERVPRIETLESESINQNTLPNEIQEVSLEKLFSNEPELISSL
jgi:hypothetical protein